MITDVPSTQQTWLDQTLYTHLRYMLSMKSSQHNVQVALAACALPIRQPRQLRVKHVQPDLELMILMRQGFRCRDSKWWGWVKQQLKLVHVADS